MNRLVTSDMTGKFSKPISEQLSLERMYEIDRDIDGTYSIDFGKLVTSKNAILDENGKSYVYDFVNTTEIDRIELFRKCK